MRILLKQPLRLCHVSSVVFGLGVHIFDAGKCTTLQFASSKRPLESKLRIPDQQVLAASVRPRDLFGDVNFALAPPGWMSYLCFE